MGTSVIAVVPAAFSRAVYAHIRPTTWEPLAAAEPVASERSQVDGALRQAAAELVDSALQALAERSPSHSLLVEPSEWSQPAEPRVLKQWAAAPADVRFLQRRLQLAVQLAG